MFTRKKQRWNSEKEIKRILEAKKDLMVETGIAQEQTHDPVGVLFFFAQKQKPPNIQKTCCAKKNCD